MVQALFLLLAIFGGFILLRWIFLRWLIVWWRQKFHTSRDFQNGPDSDERRNEQGQGQNDFAPQTSAHASLQASFQMRWQERERQIQLQREDLEQRHQNQSAQLQSRIDALESERTTLYAEKIRLETVLEQQGNLQAQLLEQSKLSWQELSRKQQEEQSESVLQNLRPLQQQLQYFQQQLEQQHQDGIKNTAQLEHYLKHLQDDTKRLSDDAQNLTDALKGDQQRQGAWGEMILARTLEQSGLREGVEYQLQKSFSGEGGQTFRPDAVVQFPGQRYIIIDSKVSLKAYEAYLAARDDEERDKQLKKHCESISRQIKDLADKKYQQLLGVQQSPDFILLFCPIEGALAEALRHESRLFEEGFRQHVVLVSPSLMFVVLRIVEQLWRYEKQRHNVAKVYAQAGKIFDKLALFCTDMNKVEQQCNTLHKSVEQATQRLSNGRQSLLRQVQKLQELGADTTKELPAFWLDSEPLDGGDTHNNGLEHNTAELPLTDRDDRELVNATA